MSTLTLLGQLRQHTNVDCDTLDVSVAKELGPFVDCTSNQAIAYLELTKPGYESLIQEATTFAKTTSTPLYQTIPWQALAVETCMVKLATRILPYLTGKVHVQVNPAYAYDTAATIAAAQRIISLFHYHANIPSDRICIKIPSTWEGLQAIKSLSQNHINTLATTLFTIDQAIVAAQVGATYIAPYVNELAVHFEPGFVDAFPGFDVCVQAQRLYRRNGVATKVLPASLTSVAECMALQGVDHITIAPALLREMSKAKAGSVGDADAGVGSVEGDTVTEIKGEIEEKVFRMAMTRRDGGRGEIKQVKAVNVFAGFQEKLEALMEASIAASGATS